MDRFLVVTGLPALDAVVKRWPGVSLFLGPEKRARTALSAQMAFETARTGKPVLWLCAGGEQDVPLLMMMCWIAKLAVRRVFVQRDLRPAEWRRFETAAAAVSRLPLRFADAHGASAGELEDAFCRSIAETHVEHRLLVVDHLDAPPKPILPHLEQLSAVVRVPVLVLFDTNEPFGQPPSVHETGLRPGSRVLFLDRCSPSSAFAKDDAPGEDTFVLGVQAVGSGGGRRTILLTYDSAHSRIRSRRGSSRMTGVAPAASRIRRAAR